MQKTAAMQLFRDSNVAYFTMIRWPSKISRLWGGGGCVSKQEVKRLPILGSFIGIFKTCLNKTYLIERPRLKLIYTLRFVRFAYLYVSCQYVIVPVSKLSLDFPAICPVTRSKTDSYCRLL